MAGVTRERARSFYEDFSVAVGVRDWLVTNARHEQLRLFVREFLGRRRELRILDFGCGAGVMTDRLRRYGDVTGVDFSGPAIAAARSFTARPFGRRPAFAVGSLDALPGGVRFDVITLFDVLEHIPHDEVQDFLADLRTRLVDGGLVIASTPHPAYTRHKRRIGDDGLQIIDEEVEPADLLRTAARADLQLLRYQAYDVFAGSPEYQIMVFTTTRSPGGPPALRSRRLESRVAWRHSRAGRRALRATRAVRVAAGGDLRAARIMLTERPPVVRT